MAKIVIDARIINSTTGRYVERLLTFLQKLDHKNQYVVLVPSEDKDFWKPTAKNFSIQICDAKNYSFAEQTKFKKQLDSLQADLVHFCMPQQPILYRGKTVTTFHDLTLMKTYNDDKNWLKYKTKQLIGKVVFKTVAKKSDAIITPSLFTKSDLVDFANIDADKVTVIYEASDISKSKPQKVRLPFQDFIIYVGKHSSYKNLLKLAEAHQKILKKHKDLGLVFANRLDAAAIRNQRLFKKLGYKKIYFMGQANNAELAWLYAHCKAYVFPSTMEGFGLPGLEAMEFGAPVVSSNATCLPEIYGNAANYFNPASVKDIVKKITEVLENKTLRAKLIKNGKKQLQKYSWEKMAKETLSVYHKVLKKP
ncbi:MAG: glycosyltransferase family 4 protein [Candidatus Nomurabacteria bacterium]|jgi:glycosyltransferase involved in cell wall biosynthesis|nr:glycosyltransferase family 4 protein [Candidatus Nomurabacteria bacterium]